MGPKSKSDGCGVPKPGTKQAKAAVERSAGASKRAQNTVGEQKKPTVKEIIGGTSWTGKLPVNMLSEHCQKQKWEKPEYTMAKTPEGYVSTVMLKRVDPKTRDLVTLSPMQLPPTHKQLAAQPTALEARHFAAAFALFRICNMRNLHMMMPPVYKMLWKEDFTEIMKADIASGKAWMYEADPFLAKQERDSAAAELGKKKKERDMAQSKAKDVGKVDLRLHPSDLNNDGHLWSHAPKVDMGTRIRRDIEELLRQHAMWNPHNVCIPMEEEQAILEDFTRLGFRCSHIEEAVAECKDREEVLEWLLVYVPEDDLPRWSLPENYAAGVSLATDDLANEAKTKRLASTGYSADLCSQILNQCKGDELVAAECLQRLLVHGTIASLGKSTDADDGAWAEEQATLEAVFGDRYSRFSFKGCEIKFRIPNLPDSISVRFSRPSEHYPSAPPIVSIQAKELPAYIRLSAVRQTIQYAEVTFLGEPMVYNILDWIEANLPGIVDNPGKLRDISSTNVVPPIADNLNKGLLMHKSRNRTGLVDAKAKFEKSSQIRMAWEAKQATQAQRDMIEKRKVLPAWSMQEAIIHSVNSHQVTIISGETGSGKSTQSVQFLLDDMIKRDLGAKANIICTQPRRISALALADRVSDERCSSVGAEVGYIIRGDSKVKADITKIIFVTTGVLLRRMQTESGPNGILGDSLAGVSHVVVDEVHERSLDTDFLLALLKDVLRYRKQLKVILMSATLDADIFINYFGGIDNVGVINIPGRTFPVNDYYLDDVLRETGFVPELPEKSFADESVTEDMTVDGSLGKILRGLGTGINYDLVASTVGYICAQLENQIGGILIFVSGTLEIERCLTALKKIPNVHALPLHASLLPAEQRRVFMSPPKGKRKVIAATNVAETSITIEDIVAVIDTGRVKETSYDFKDNIVRLQEVWASQAACKQRRGRAGRVRSGSCYKLYTRKAEANMTPRPEPEIRRLPLGQLCLAVKAMRGIDDVAAFLANTITPPESTAVEGALRFLHRVGALDHDKLTALGRYLSMIPADLRCAKLMIYGTIFGCMDACITIAAILTVKSPFISPREKREQADAARASFSKGDGDVLTDVEAYQQWSDRTRAQGYWQTQSWCTANFLSHQTLRDISSNRAHLMTSLKDAGIVPVDYAESEVDSTSSRWNRNGGNKRLLRALIAGAFHPQIAQIRFPDKKFATSVTGTVEVDPDARTIRYFNQENGRVFVHPCSILFSAQNYTGAAAFLSYFAKMATSKVFIRELTPFNALSLLLFCGSITLDTMGRGVIVDDWLRLRGWARIGVLVSRLRLMLDDVLAMYIDNPTLALSGASSTAAVSSGVLSSSSSSSSFPIANEPEVAYIKQQLERSDRVVELVKRLIEFNGLDQ